MKYQDIISLLETDPNSENISLAKKWLCSQAKVSKSVEDVAHALLKAANSKEAFVWLSDTWLLDENWSILCWAVDNMVLSDESIDWIVQFASAKPKHQDAGKLWSTTLSKYNSPDRVRKSCEWLLDYGNGEDAADVACDILPKCHDQRIFEKAKQLVWDNPANHLLIGRVIELVGDEEIEELALTRLRIEYFIVAGMWLARPLLKRNPCKYASTLIEWLRENTDESGFVSILAELFTASPTELAPFVFEWLNKNPQIGNVEKIFQMVFISAPSQGLFDQTWNWISNHLKGRHTARMLNVILSNASEELECPEDACVIADSWLAEHIKHVDAKELLLSALSIDATPSRIDLALKWLRCHNLDDSGEMLMSLVRTAACPKVEAEAMAWVYERPNDRVSHAILLGLLSCSPKNAYIVEAKRALNSDGLHRFFRYLFLCELVKLGDKDSFDMAFSLIENDKEWRTSLKELGGNLLLGLLEQAPGNMKAVHLADEWLATGTKDFEELSMKISQAQAKSL